MAEEYNPEQMEYLKQLQGQHAVSGGIQGSNRADQYSTDEATAYENYSPVATRDYVNPQQEYQMQSSEFGDEDYGDSYIDDYLGIAAPESGGGYYSDDFAGEDTGGHGGGYSSEDPTEGMRSDRMNTALDKAMGIGQFGWGDVKSLATKGGLIGGAAKNLGATTKQAIKGGILGGVTGYIPQYMLGKFADVSRREMMQSDLEDIAGRFGLDPESKEGQQAIMNSLVSNKGFLDSDESALNFAFNEKKDRGFFSGLYDTIMGNEYDMTGLQQSKDPDTGRITSSRAPAPEDGLLDRSMERSVISNLQGGIDTTMQDNPQGIQSDFDAMNDEMNDYQDYDPSENIMGNYGAEYYAPIERGLASINRQLNINSQRADDREAAGLQRLLTASQLQTQQENRSLQRRTAERSDTRLKETIAANKHTRLSQIDAMNYRKKQEYRADLDFTAAAGERKAKIAKTKRQHTPIPVNVFNGKTRTIRIIEVAAKNKKQIEAVYGGSENVEYIPSTGAIINRATGKPLMLSPFEHANKYAAALSGIFKIAFDPQAVNRGDQTQLTSEIDSLKTKQRESSTNSMGAERLIDHNAKIQVQINKLKARLQRRQNVTIDDKLDLYKEQENSMMESYIIATQNGISSEVGLYFELGLAQNKAMQDRLYKQKAAKLKAASDAATSGGGSAGFKIKKMRIDNIFKSRAIYMGAMKDVDLTTGPMRDEVLKVRDEAKRHWQVGAIEFVDSGYAPAEIGLTVEEVDKIRKEIDPPEGVTDIKGKDEVNMTPKKEAPSAPKGFPSASKYKNKTAEDTSTGKKYKSDGTNWIEM